MSTNECSETYEKLVAPGCAVAFSNCLGTYFLHFAHLSLRRHLPRIIPLRSVYHTYLPTSITHSRPRHEHRRILPTLGSILRRYFKPHSPSFVSVSTLKREKLLRSRVFFPTNAVEILKSLWCIQTPSRHVRAQRTARAILWTLFEIIGAYIL